MTNSRNLSGAEIRRQFIEYFEELGHTFVPSSSLVLNDPTLLLTNSGMVQFKDVFVGSDKRPYSRAANSQKCMRVSGKHNDLDDVGRDDTHHTFFEMLGSWSFGDYYKKEAIAWAWHLLTKVWGLSPERLYTTCFKDDKGNIPQDSEAAEIWQAQPGFIASHVSYLGRKDNFWEMGDRGPCGPCSEIHYDLGEDLGALYDANGNVDLDGKRFLEIWNLVFMQYNRTGETTFEPLPAKHVDTGMGFERIVSVLQGVRSNYDTDLFRPLMDTVQQMAGHTAAQRAEQLTPYRVIADHARSAAFMVADGVAPGNTGRGYICRMIIRRASRFGFNLGFDKPFLAKVAETVIREYGDFYPELRKNQSAILATITAEETRFLRTLDRATNRLENIISEMLANGQSVMEGQTAFELFSTYGLPAEITNDVLLDRGLTYDRPGYLQAREAHAIASGKGQALGIVGGEKMELHRELLEDLQASGDLNASGVEYLPYGPLELRSQIIALLVDGNRATTATVGQNVEVVLKSTPFYVESGGQVSDTGSIACFADGEQESLWEIQVTGIVRQVQGLIVHQGKVLAGTPRVKDVAFAIVNDQRRWDIMRNHTATHLLHAQLREVLGSHARQAGSLVAPERLRFDFNHEGMLTSEQLDEITRGVNEYILDNYKIKIDYMGREEAIKAGATALFGEKYGEVVRTVQIGDPSLFSFELCGGTHVPETSDIGPFVIVGESSVQAGIRRIEAVTGRGALELIRQRLGVLTNLSSVLQTKPDEADKKVLALLDEASRLRKELAQLKRDTALKNFTSRVELAARIENIPVLVAQVEVENTDILRTLTDQFWRTHDSGVVALGAEIDGKPNLVVAVSPDMVRRGLHAGNIIRIAAQEMGGGGGGKPTLAQAGGKDAARLPEALQTAQKLIEQALAE